MTGYRKRPPSDHQPMAPVVRAAIYQGARGLLGGGLGVVLIDDIPAGLTGPQRRRWLHKSRRLAAKGAQ